MKFTPLNLAPAHVIDLAVHADDRGYFARAWCRSEFEEAGLKTAWEQTNLSYTRRKGTIRGMHYQVGPWREVKLVRCLRGCIYDVIADVRPDSPTYMQWQAVELDAASLKWIYVPEGFAHGFQSLTDEVEVLYQVSQSYHPEAERGFRHDDARFQISWPLEVSLISAKDASWPAFSPEPVLP
ncbi:MAG: dTDP-4-dehydrorhamnose 3,5-epimerase [Acidimicrobiia bacterium]|nr:dTDP-4-dehydrorhamnose 3,5-epimerase [Acidimicrobiia bacterium]